MSEITPTNPLTVMNPSLFDVRLALPDALASLDRVSSNIASDVDAPNSAARSAPDALIRENVIESLIRAQTHPPRALPTTRLSLGDDQIEGCYGARSPTDSNAALEPPTSSIAARATPRSIPTLARTALSRSLASVDDDAVAHATRGLARTRAGSTDDSPAFTTVWDLMAFDD